MGFKEGGDAGIANFQTCQLVIVEEEKFQLQKLAKFRWDGAWTRGGVRGL